MYPRTTFYLTYQQSKQPCPSCLRTPERDRFYDVVVPLLPDSALQEEIRAVRDGRLAGLA